MSFPYSSVDKESACDTGDPDLTSGWGRSPREVIGYPLQYFGASLVDQLVKNLPAMQETWVLATLWTVAHQALLSMGFSRQEYWRLLPFPSTGNLLDPGTEPTCIVACIVSNCIVREKDLHNGIRKNATNQGISLL